MTVKTQMATDTSTLVPSVPIWRLSTAQYHEMIRAGILTDDDPVELLEGWLVPEMPKNPPHRLSTQLIREALAACIREGYFVDAQEPITTGDSEPEPDVMVVRGSRRDYSERHPTGLEVPLVIEVSDATLTRDRSVKKSIYARAGVSVYWIVNLPERQIEVYSKATGDSYMERQDYREGESVPVLVAGQEVGWLEVSEVLP